MSDKVFWSILGAEVVVWIVLFVLLVMPKMSEYDSVTGKLRKQQSSLREYSKKVDRDLPTKDLLEAEEKFNASWSKQLDRAEEFFSSRVSRFEEGASSDLSGWTAGYRDGFDLLAKRYRSTTGLAADAELPFSIQDDLADMTKIVDYERRWKVQNHLVNLTLDNRGSEILELVIDRKTTRGSRSADEGPSRFPVSLKMTIPGNRVSEFLGQIMKHPFIDYSVEKVAVSKDRQNLLYDVVNEVSPEEGDMGEPNVLLLLEMQVHEGAVIASSESERS